MLYEANSQLDFGDWPASPSWKTDEALLTNDGREYGLLLAPFDVPVSDYAVEAEIEYVSSAMLGTGCETPRFGVVARVADGDAAGGYLGGLIIPERRCVPDDDARIWYLEDVAGIAAFPDDSGTNAETFDPEGWDVYRLEVNQGNVRFLINNDFVADDQSRRYLDAGRAGLWSGGAMFRVRRFTILSLD